MARRNVPLRQRFGTVLRDARLAAGLSQEELAHRASLHVSYISQLERGLKSPSLDALFALAEALGVQGSALVVRAEE